MYQNISTKSDNVQFLNRFLRQTLSLHIFSLLFEKFIKCVRITFIIRSNNTHSYMQLGLFVCFSGPFLFILCVLLSRCSHIG